MIRGKKPGGQAAGMTRRNFLKTGGALGAGAVLSASGTSCGPEGNPPGAGTKRFPFELEEATLADLRSGLAEGRLTCRRITSLYLERIKALDKKGPATNAVLEVNPEAMATAASLDKELREKGSRSPLHGIPVLIKGNIDTADGMSTTAGSLALLDSRPGRDAFIVEKLRRAGAVILGKTNLSEWANFRSSRSSSGWSSHGGQTRNPYALDRNPSGSSSGSAVGAAACFCALAVGTETDGSIVSPSSVNGIVGIKPTVGLISRSGIVPIAHSQDTAGPLARTVADAAALLSVLAGEDPRDPATAASRGKTIADYTPFLKRDGLKGARIGIARSFFGFHEKVARLMEDVILALKSEGAEVIDPVEIIPKERYGDAEYEVLLYEFKADLDSYLAARSPSGPIRSLKDVIAFNESHRAAVMPYFEQEIMLQAEKKGPLTSPEYLKALEACRRLSRTEGIDKALADGGLDAVVAPTDGPAWVTDLVNGDHFIGGSSQPSAVSGYPSITVPAGAIFGLPIGVSFIGGAFEEAKLIRLAYAFEQATKHRKAPAFLPRVDLAV